MRIIMGFSIGKGVTMVMCCHSRCHCVFLRVNAHAGETFDCTAASLLSVATRKCNTGIAYMVPQFRPRAPPTSYRVLKSRRMSSDVIAEVKQATLAMQASYMARCCEMPHSRLPTVWRPLCYRCIAGPPNKQSPV